MLLILFFYFRELFHWLNMQCDECVGAEMLFQFMFNLKGSGVDSVEGERTVHPEVHLDGITVTYAACAQVVRVVYVRE